MPYFIHLYTKLPYLPAGTSADSQLAKDFALPAWQKSLTTSILSADTFFGAIIAGDVADLLVVV